MRLLPIIRGMGMVLGANSGIDTAESDDMVFVRASNAVP